MLTEFQKRKLTVAFHHHDMDNDGLLGQADYEQFVPLLTKDYLAGPISRPELDQALRVYYQERTKRVVPLLLEGKFEDYHSHFLGGFHIVDMRKGLTTSRFDEVANLCLGLTRNPYE